MRVRKLCGLVLGICILMFNPMPLQATLYQGSFVPVNKSKTLPIVAADRYYQVQKGDTLWSISRNFNADLPTLLFINNLKGDSVLEVGQSLQIPQHESIIHVIKPGETFWAISYRYDVSVAQLQSANKNKNPRNLKIGDQLVIPNKMVQLASIRIEEPSRGVKRGALTWPLSGKITSPFGSRSSGFHHGLDIAGKSGDPIKACAEGTVSFVGYRSVYGLMVIIDHPDGKQTLYAHTNKTYVNQGEPVALGQVIASVGTTGKTTGPHLHLEVRINNQAYDPINYLR